MLLETLRQRCRYQVLKYQPFIKKGHISFCQLKIRYHSYLHKHQQKFFVCLYFGPHLLIFIISLKVPINACYCDVATWLKFLNLNPALNNSLWLPGRTLMFSFCLDITDLRGKPGSRNTDNMIQTGPGDCHHINWYIALGSIDIWARRLLFLTWYRPWFWSAEI